MLFAIPLTSILNATATAAFAVAAIAWLLPARNRASTPGRAFVLLQSAATALLAVSLAIRWHDLGHGPFISLHEIVLSSAFSLSLLTLAGYALVPAIRDHFAFVLVVILLLCVWLPGTDPRPTVLPPTYDTPWLYVHVVAGKAFLALLLLASSVAVQRGWLAARGRLTVATAALQDELAYRFLLVAITCHSLMLLIGAVWAQDAWGRYWAWDPLETWAFMTWLAMAFILHLRAWRRVPAAVPTLLVPLAFVLAFLTFFGVPFLSLAPHKGMI